MTATEFTRERRRPQVASLVVHVGGATLGLLAVGIVISAAVEAGAGGTHVHELLVSAAVVGVVGAVLWWTTTIPDRTTAGATFVAVGGTWLFAAAGGAVPYLLCDTFPTVDDALFESISGFTGTGSTVMADIEANPRGILFWRNMTQWFGGTGMVVLAVAVLPFLGSGGMELLRAEAPGPSADRLAPRVSETAKRLWFVYGGFTVVAIGALAAVGMSPFDAVTHAFTVVSTGGLSPYNNSIGAFDSLAVELVLIVLMLYGATSMTLHYAFLTGDRRAYLRSTMFRYYIAAFAVCTVAIAGLLMWHDGFGFGQALRDASFNVATLLSSTGFGTADYVQWTAAAQLILLGLMVTGGMAGSTAGGLKLIRFRILTRFAAREVSRIRHPSGVHVVRLDDDVIPDPIVQRVVGYTLFYVVFIATGTLVVAMLGGGVAESVGAATSVMGNMGPAFGEAGPASNFLVFERPARAVLAVMMLAGRLEILPVMFVVLRLTRSIRPAGRRARYRARRRMGREAAMTLDGGPG